MSDLTTKLAEALRRIADWSALDFEFRVNYGSNGERDYYRQIARAALAAFDAQAATSTEQAEREAFEKWTVGFYAGLATAADTWDEKRSSYTDYAHHMAWCLWRSLADARVAQSAQPLPQQPAQAVPLSVPHPGSPEASAMIDSELELHGWPANQKNAARAGYEACRKLAGLGVKLAGGGEGGMSIEELRELCAMTVELTRLRQNECRHLAIDNFAPDLLGKLIRERLAATSASQTAQHWQQQPLVHYSYACEVTDRQRSAIPTELARMGDAVLVWANEGQLCHAGMRINATPPTNTKEAP